LIDRDYHAKIADFGLTIVGEATGARYTTTGGMKGSVGWVAPERYEASRRKFPGDVYAYGFICVEVKAPTHDIICTLIHFLAHHRNGTVCQDP
jgi:serine/threonine protein kinase